MIISRNKLDRLVFTLGIIAIYRLATFIVVPGLDHSVIASFYKKNESILGIFNSMFGGALSRMSIMSLNLMPYVSASIMMRLLTTIIPELKAFKKDSYQRKRINQYTRFMTLILSLFQSTVICFGLEAIPGLVINPGIMFRLTTILSIVSSSLLIMWLSEKISEGGIGNGSSMIIFCGIVANGWPMMLEYILKDPFSSKIAIAACIFALFALSIVFCEGIRYNIRIFFKRNYIVFKESQIGNKPDFLPIKLNPSGILPSMFADNAMIMFSVLVRILEYLVSFSITGKYLDIIQLIFKCVLVSFFTFFCLTISMNPEDVSENLRSRGAYLFGVFEGNKTTEYIEMLLNRIAFMGCIYLLFIVAAPEILRIFFGIPGISGTSLLICYGIAAEILNRLAPEPKEIRA